MNKNLLALAVAGALTAPGLALAQATTAGTNVQIYGVLDVKWDMMKLTQSTSGTIGSIRKDHLATGAPNRIGFRGTEALGGGMTAFFQVETQMFTDARQDVGAQQHTNATLGGRPTFLGIRGGWGEVSGGYQESIYKDVQQATWSVAPSNTHAGVIMGNANTSGSMPTPDCAAAHASGTNLLNTVTTTCTEAPGSTTSFNRTMSDSINYRSPVFAGFRFSTQYAAQEFKEPTITTAAGAPVLPAAGVGRANPTFAAYSLTWSGGPFAAAAAVEQHRGFRAVAGATAVAGQDRNAKDTGFTLGGRWNYGAGLIGLGYERLKYGNVGVPGAATDNGFDLKSWVVQGTFNLTPSDVLYGAYSKTPGRTNCGAALNTIATATVGSACGTDTGAKFWHFGIDHSFSKRTAVYAFYSKIDNNASATYNYPSDSRPTNNVGTTAGTAGASAGLAAGVDSTSYNVGVKHSF